MTPDFSQRGEDTMGQGVLPFRFKVDDSQSGMTSFGIHTEAKRAVEEVVASA
jgi:hypothetical protein